MQYSPNTITYQLPAEKITLRIFRLTFRPNFGIDIFRIGKLILVEELYPFESAFQCTLNHLNRISGEKVMIKILKTVQLPKFRQGGRAPPHERRAPQAQNSSIEACQKAKACASSPNEKKRVCFLILFWRVLIGIKCIFQCFVKGRAVF